MNAAPLVLLHGFTNTGASWDRVGAALGERYRPIAPDIRGHGSAGAQQPVTLPAVIDDVAALVEGRFALAGYSMGGRIALHVALALGPRIQRLLLIGASPGLAEEAERELRRQADDRLAAELEAGDIEAFAERWAQSSVLADQPAELRAEMHADRLRSSPLGLARALRGLGTGTLPSLWDRLGELAIPVTLVVGERDRKFTALARQMVARLPAGRVAIVPGSGHAVHLEAPAKVARMLRAPDCSRTSVETSSPRTQSTS